MQSGVFSFEGFRLDLADRRLSRAGETVDLNARYFDALALLVREHGKLVSKDRFLDEVWRGTPVTDEALTQCIRSIRRCLGDDAGQPRFIETVPKHGYRFIARLETSAEPVEIEPAPRVSPTSTWKRIGAGGLAGAIGGGGAGALGGLLYGLAGAAGTAPSLGASSTVLVLVVVTALVGLLGGGAVGLGLAASERAKPSAWSVLGGAWGGMAVGAVVKLVGVDTFSLLLGQAPTEITGAAEGAVLGGAVGLGAWLAGRGGSAPSPRRGMAIAALTGGAAGLVISASGGRLMGGSLAALVDRFPGSRLDFHAIGAVFGEAGLGPIARLATSGLEGALFSACVVGALIVARRST